MLKGLLEGCILYILSKEENYGYVITEMLNEYGFTELNEGTVYPVLVRLEKKGYILGEKRKSELGPKRKYFKLSPEGEKVLEDFILEWSSVSSTVNRIIESGDPNE